MTASRPPVRLAVTVAGLDEPQDEVLGRGFRRPPGIGEADQIRQHMIAERARDLCAARADDIRHVQALRLLDVAATVAENVRPSVRARISSSVAIHRNPAAAASGTIASDTDPSDGHEPDRPAAEQALVIRGRAFELHRPRPPGRVNRSRGIRESGWVRR